MSDNPLEEETTLGAVLNKLLEQQGVEVRLTADAVLIILENDHARREATRLAGLCHGLATAGGKHD